MVTVNGAGRASPVRWKRRFADYLGGRRGRASTGWQEPAAETRVTVIDTVAVEERPARQDRGRRPQAAFVAQLLAARLDLPQSRTNRRAGVDEADASYHASDPAAQGTRRGAIVRRDI
jgi:hypothetical protein